MALTFYLQSFFILRELRFTARARR
jgi:hypothetical protein